MFLCLSHILLDSLSTHKSRARPGNWNFNCAFVAHATMVPQIAKTTDQETTDFAISTKSTFTSFLRQTSSITGSSEANCMPLIWETLRQQGISRPAATIILESWRTSTRKCYKSALGKWIHFCSRRETHPIRTDVTTILDFLAKEFFVWQPIQQP